MNCIDKAFNWDCRKRLARKMEFEQLTYDFKKNHFYTPLTGAAAYCHLAAVRLLVKSGADVNLVHEKVTALGIAAEHGNYKCVELLVKLGARVNVDNSTTRPALMCAISDHRHVPQIIQSASSFY